MELRVKTNLQGKRNLIQGFGPQRWECMMLLYDLRCQGNPTIGTLEKVATALGVSVPELFAPQPTNTITCPHCGKLIKVEKGE